MFLLHRWAPFPRVLKSMSWNSGALESSSGASSRGIPTLSSVYFYDFIESLSPWILQESQWRRWSILELSRELQTSLSTSVPTNLKTLFPAWSNSHPNAGSVHLVLLCDFATHVGGEHRTQRSFWQSLVLTLSWVLLRSRENTLKKILRIQLFLSSAVLIPSVPFPLQLVFHCCFPTQSDSLSTLTPS